MSNQEILDFVASFHYACLYVSESLPSKHCGPGQEQWEHDLASLTDTERFSLSERIQQCLNIIAKNGGAQ